MSFNARIEALEEKVEKLDKMSSALDDTGRLVVELVQAALNQLVDERYITADTRRAIWDRIKAEIARSDGPYNRVRAKAEGAIPHVERNYGRKIEPVRDRKKILRPRPRHGA